MSNVQGQTSVIANTTEGVERATVTHKKSFGWPIVEDQDEDPKQSRSSVSSSTRSAQDENSPYTSDSDSIGATTDEELSSAQICHAEHVKIYSSSEASSLIKVASLKQSEKPHKDTLEDLLEYFATTGGEIPTDERYARESQPQGVNEDLWPRPASQSTLANRENPGRSCVMWDAKEEWYSPGLDLNYLDPHTREQKVLFRKFLKEPFVETKVTRTEYVSPFDTSLGPSRSCYEY